MPVKNRSTIFSVVRIDQQKITPPVIVGTYATLQRAEEIQDHYQHGLLKSSFEFIVQPSTWYDE